MSLGVSFDGYWHGDTENLKYYIKKSEIENDKKNFWLWWQGQYLMQAFHFQGKKNPKLNYPKEPIRLRAMTDEERDEKLEKSLFGFIENVKSAVDIKTQKRGGRNL